MKKYILKKDLPTLKAGALFQEDNEGIWACNPPQYRMRFGFPKAALNDFPDVLTDWFEEVPEEPKTVWALKDGEEYYQIAQTGSINTEVWDGMYYDRDSREAGNVFLTQEEAQKELARRKAKQVLLRDAKGFKPDWSDWLQWKYTAAFDYRAKALSIDESCLYQSSNIYFASRADIKASIKAHEKEWKIYLGVSDE